MLDVRITSVRRGTHLPRPPPPLRVQVAVVADIHLEGGHQLLAAPPAPGGPRTCRRGRGWCRGRCSVRRLLGPLLQQPPPPVPLVPLLAGLLAAGGGAALRHVVVVAQLGPGQL